jgi:hypothetical protein
MLDNPPAHWLVRYVPASAAIVEAASHQQYTTLRIISAKLRLRRSVMVVQLLLALHRLSAPQLPRRLCVALMT